MDRKITTSFVLPPITTVECKGVREYTIGDFKELYERTNIAKSLYDAKPSLNICKNLAQYEHMYLLKPVLKSKNVLLCTNAMAKAIELFQYYKVFPRSAESFTYFDNAALPGAFILAANYMVSTMHDIKQFKWHGSSMLPEFKIGENNSPLGDKFNLYRNYKSRWLMSDENNGDVTIVANQLNFEERLGNKVDLYTSDLGFDVSDDYTKQEFAQSHANFGQIITGLIVLKRGGIMITKQYSYFDSCTISTMAIMTKMFDRVEICKPLFSKQANSETYLVGIGFRDNFHLYRDCMFERLENWKYTPLVAKKDLGKAFIDAIIKSQTYFAEAQIAQINLMMAQNAPPSPEHCALMRSQLTEWMRLYQLPVMPRNKTLNTKKHGGYKSKISHLYNL